MFLEEALRTHLLSNPTLNAQIGGRISPGYLPENSPIPALVLSRVSSVPEYSHDGYEGGLESRMQISCIARTYSEIKTLSANVKFAMRPLEQSPRMIGGTSGVYVAGAYLENETDIYEESDIDVEKRFHIPMDWLVQWYEE